MIARRQFLRICMLSVLTFLGGLSSAGAANYVTLTNAVTLPALLDIEQHWFDSNYPACSITSFGHPLNVPTFLKRRIYSEAIRSDRFIFARDGINRQVFFVYGPIVQANVESLWTNYINHITSKTQNADVWLIAFSDFRSAVYRMKIADTLPYLIEQLNDVRPVKIYFVQRRTRVCDLDIFAFLVNLRRVGSSANVFPEIADTNVGSWPLKTKLKAEESRAKIRNWWSSTGTNLLDDGELTWREKQ